jgi:integrase
VDILRPLWIEKHETGRRLRGRIEAILDYAADPDDMAYRNPAGLTSQLQKKLPRLPASKRPQHHAALPYVEIGAFMADLRQRSATAARALEFLILTATRTSETLLAQWSEIDFGTRMWTIPADRMKAGKPHRVPLSDAAMEILQNMRGVQQGDFVFPEAGPAAVEYGAAHPARPHGLCGHHIAWFPLDLPGLGKRRTRVATCLRDDAPRWRCGLNTAKSNPALATARSFRCERRCRDCIGLQQARRIA